MSRSCHRVTFSSSAGTTAERTTRARPVTFSVSTGLRLCGIDDEPFWPGEKNSFGFAHFGALQVADLGGEVLDRGGDDGQRREERGVAVARDHLRRHGLEASPSFCGHVILHPRIDRGEGAYGAGDRAGRDLGACRLEPLAVAREGRVVAGELDAKGRGLGMDAVAAADRDGVLVLEGALLRRRQQLVGVFQQDDRQPAWSWMANAGVEDRRTR